MTTLEKILQEIDTIKVGVNTECRHKCKLYDWSVGACVGDCEIYVKEMAKDIIKKHLSDNDRWIPVEKRLPELSNEYDERVYYVQSENVFYPFLAYWNGIVFIDDEDDIVEDAIAWHHLPKPYKKGEK